MHLQPAVIVEQQDEVVLGAVSLDEGDIGQGGERGIRSAHVSILSVGPARMSSARARFRSASAALPSIQWMRGSRRNQVSCRRGNWRVRTSGGPFASPGGSTPAGSRRVMGEPEGAE